MDSGYLEYNVIVLKWGNKFTSKHVNRLYRMAKRNITLPFNFYCYTDDSTGIYNEVNIIPLDESLDLKKWWWKLTLFKQNDLNKGINLFLDLDVVIQNNIDHLFTKVYRNKLTLIDQYSFTDDLNWYFSTYKSPIPPSQRPYYNSSIMIWYNNENLDFFDIFIKKYKTHVNLYHGIDGFLSHEICPSRFSDIGFENYYYRTKIRVNENFVNYHNIQIDIPTEKFTQKGMIKANFSDKFPICIFNQCHEDVFYQGMENYLI